MKKRVMLVELTVYERVLPLVSGYLQAYACQDPDIRASVEFDCCSVTVKTPAAAIVQRLADADSDIYAFSCYVWNMGLTKTVVRALRARRPEAVVLFGGPQVMNHASAYLAPDARSMFVCNGEGERTFSDFLRETLAIAPDFARVHGLSFYQDGELVTTSPAERIRDLNEIPSPFLSGVFRGVHSTSIFETNRGCPFKCGFCFWGAATNDRLAKFDDARIREELTWLSRKGLVCLYLADANWGMLERDIAFSDHIAAGVRAHGSPRVVYYSAAKNRPDRLTAITEIFKRAGVVTAQPVSMQSMTAETLELVERKNIKLSSYIDLQSRLREKKISSFTELIWPLPGETVDSFRAGLDRLCAANSGTVITYPHLLLHNTQLSRRADDLGFQRKQLDDGIAEVEIVIGTAQVSLEQFQQGMRLFYSMHVLYNMRSLTAVGRYLHERGTLTFGGLFDAFAEFSRRRRRDFPIAEFCEASIEQDRYYDIFNYGTVVHLALHAERASLDWMLHEFVRAQPWWEDAEARARFEVDLYNRPYVYSNTPTARIEYPFEHTALLDVQPGKYLVSMPAALVGLVNAQACDEHVAGTPACVMEVDHKRQQYPFMSAQSLDHNAGYCHGMILRVEDMLPVWSAAAVPA